MAVQAAPLPDGPAPSPAEPVQSADEWHQLADLKQHAIDANTTLREKAVWIGNPWMLSTNKSIKEVNMHFNMSDIPHGSPYTMSMILEWQGVGALRVESRDGVDSLTAHSGNTAMDTFDKAKGGDVLTSARSGDLTFIVQPSPTNSRLTQVTGYFNLLADKDAPIGADTKLTHPIFIRDVDSLPAFEFSTALFVQTGDPCLPIEGVSGSVTLQARQEGSSEVVHLDYGEAASSEEENQKCDKSGVDSRAMLPVQTDGPDVDTVVYTISTV
ncbi:hypothetical protein RI367_007352 [Sorochytrium milnesiophthora]